MKPALTRRTLLKTLGASAAALAWHAPASASTEAGEVPSAPLSEFPYDAVAVRGARQLAQQANVLDVLSRLEDDSLLKPFRAMSGQAAPGSAIGGWYDWKPDYNHHHDLVGFAPGHCFGQWTSALARLGTAAQFDRPGENASRTRALGLNRAVAETLTPAYFSQTRFAAYTYDKLVCGLMDSHRLLNDNAAFATLDRATAAVIPSLPAHAMERDVQWKVGYGQDWMWDEFYTLPENLFLISAMGAGPHYRELAKLYLLDEGFFTPLSRSQNVLGDHHAYSHVNALCSAMQAYLVGGSAMHLEAARISFDFLEQQSFATGGWGPEELLRAPGYDELYKSINSSHNSFETPCGSYAHSKLTRYLLRVTRDGRYGDSMERVLLNTLSGVLPLTAEGQTFYQQDNSFAGKRVYSANRWPCCAGTLPQVVADYGINTYLRSPGAVWVNLYQPSELRWSEAATDHVAGPVPVHLQQSGSYLEEGKVQIVVKPTHACRFELRLRIPAWSGSAATVRVNGELVPRVGALGFTVVDRTWRSGDLLQLDFAPALRLESFPVNGGLSHPELAALMWGPLVLFALRDPHESGPVAFAPASLLAATRSAPLAWSAADATGKQRSMVPFFDVKEETYSTYVKLTSAPA